MKIKEEEILKELILFFQEDYKKERDFQLIGLLSGRGGVTLCQAVLYQVSGNVKFLSEIHRNCESIIDDLNKSQEISVNYCNGVAGIGWLFLILEKFDLFPFDPKEIYDEIDDILDESLNDFLVKNDYDILHHALGLGLYFLKRGKFNEIGKILNMLEASADKEDNELKWLRFDKYNDNIPLYDFGLAHGIAGILYFVGKLYSQNVEKERSLKLIEGIVAFYLNNAQVTSEYISFYPQYILRNEYENKQAGYSRVGWCYGDLGICYTLFQVALWINDDILKEKVLKMLINISKRRGIRETSVSDPSLCHGSGGNGLIFLKLFKKTRIKEFQEAVEYYKDLCIGYGDGYSSYVKSFLSNKEREIELQSLALLTGLSGPALFLCHYLDKEFELPWEEVLFL